MSSVRVLQLVSSGGYYGLENMLVNLARALKKLDCHSIVGVFHNDHRPNTELMDQARRVGLTVEEIPCRGKADWRTLRAIRNLVRTQRVDVIHTHGYKADLYGYAASRGLPAPLIATCHNWTGQTRSLRLYALLDRTVLRFFQKIVVVSNSVGALLLKSGLPKRKILTIGNGVDLSELKAAIPTLAQDLPKGTHAVVGMVGRLVPEKGPQILLEAARGILKEFPDTAFVFVGDGPARTHLENMAREWGLASRVLFTGRRNDMPGVYASMDIFVLPSLNEGMPMTILEALAAGKPTVASRLGAIEEIILHQQTGILVEPGNVDALQTAVLQLLADPSLRRRLAEEGCARVRQNFSAESMARNYMNLYRELSGARLAA